MSSQTVDSQAAMDLLVLAQHGSNKEARAALMLGPEKYDAWLHGTRIGATKMVDFRSTNSFDMSGVLKELARAYLTLMSRPDRARGTGPIH